MRNCFKFKGVWLSTFAILLTMLTGCDRKSVRDMGFNFEVTYDLGKGIITNNGRNTHELTILYQPGSPLSDLSTVGYDYRRDSDSSDLSYEFGGWYYDEECTKPVEFNDYRLPGTLQESDQYAKDGKLRLYANWIENYLKYFKIHFIDYGSTSYYENDVELNWNINKPFNFTASRIKHPVVKDENNKEKEFTFIGAYTDEALTQKVDDNYVLTNGGENLPIYTKWIEGRYRIATTVKDVSDYFTRYCMSGYSLYLDADVDFEGEQLRMPKLLTDVTILGNGHTIKNFTYDSRSNLTGDRSEELLGGLANTISDSTIKDLNIEGAQFTLYATMCNFLRFHPLAGRIENSVVSNVSISGNVIYDPSTPEKVTITVASENNTACYREAVETTIENCTYDINIVTRDE